MRIIESETYAEAWLQGVSALNESEGNVQYDMMTHITRPLAAYPPDELCVKQVDAYLNSHNKQSLETVAETIFPFSLYNPVSGDPSGVYDLYPNEIYPEIMKRSDRQWGRYAYRLLRRTDIAGNEIIAHESRKPDGGLPINPLKRVIEKIRQQFVEGKGHKRPIYEIDIASTDFDLTTYDATTDRNRITQFPCLSHVSFKVDNRNPDKPKINLTALYRSHYYVEKALGNFMGLARLLFFVSHQTGLAPGSLTSVSTFATLDMKSGIDELISDCLNGYAKADKAPKPIVWSRAEGQQQTDIHSPANAVS